VSYAYVSPSPNPKTATDFNNPEVGNALITKKTRSSWYHAIDIKHVHIFFKFERRLSIQFRRKKETQNFFQRDGSTFFLKNDLFLRTEIGFK
jgi:hypothetical protein